MKYFIAAFISLALLPAVAAAQNAPAASPWYQEPIAGGCTVALVAPMNRPAEWDGACTPGEPISGPGNFRMRFEDSGRLVVMRTTFVDGAPHGDTLFEVFSLTTNEKIEEHRVVFERGCLAGADDCTPLPPH